MNDEAELRRQTVESPPERFAERLSEFARIVFAARLPDVAQVLEQHVEELSRVHHLLLPNANATANVSSNVSWSGMQP